MQAAGSEQPAYEWPVNLRQPDIQVRYDGHQCVVSRSGHEVTRVATDRILGWVDPSIPSLDCIGQSPTGRPPLYQWLIPFLLPDDRSLLLAALVGPLGQDKSLAFICPLRDSPGKAVLGWRLVRGDRAIPLSPIQIDASGAEPVLGRLSVESIRPIVIEFASNFSVALVERPLGLRYRQVSRIRGGGTVQHFRGFGLLRAGVPRLGAEALGSAHPAFLQFNRLQSAVEAPFVSSAPRWRIVAPGLNLWGKCQTEGCEAFQQWVIIHCVHRGRNGESLHTGRFELPTVCNEARCPSCSQLAENVRSCGFYRCYYQISGRIHGQDEVIETEPQAAPMSGSWRYFNDLESEDVPWEDLAITITEALAAPSSSGPCDPLYKFIEGVGDVLGQLSDDWFGR